QLDYIYRSSYSTPFIIASSSSSRPADSSSCFSSLRASTYWISSSSAPSSTSISRADSWASSFALRSLRPMAGERMSAMFFCTSTMSLWISWSRAFRRRSMTKWHSRRSLISLIFFTASIVLFQSSRSYFTGTLRRFSNSKLGSTVSSLAFVLRYALVQRSLRGFFFLLNARRHLERQPNILLTLQSLRTKTIPCPGKILLEQKKHVSIRIVLALWCFTINFDAL
uniref:Uncharacterized protein n=1 Tax=Anopheles atroparvus TaxID=41427 RepID=A0AAG5CVV9_ANOAO